MEKINELIDALHLDTELTLDEIPDIDLYMDQVIQLFESKFARTKRNEEEKILTKTMINNYAKGKLFFPIHNKRYSKDHLIMISMIYQLKGTLSINDIKKTLNILNEKVAEDDFNIEKVYESYLHISKNNVERFTEDTQKCATEVNVEIADLRDRDTAHLDQLLLLASFVNMSNFYRRAAEKIVDEITTSESKHK